MKIKKCFFDRQKLENAYTESIERPKKVKRSRLSVARERLNLSSSVTLVLNLLQCSSRSNPDPNIDLC